MAKNIMSQNWQNLLLSVDDDPDRDNTDLVGDANDVADKLPDRIFKALNTGHQVCLL